MTRTLEKLPVLLVALIALSLGIVGTATAGDTVGKLTNGKVKKIAAKVVEKQAPTLSVASATTATTAGTATNLNGKPASAYLDNVTVYAAVFAATASTSRSVPIPLGPGSYQIGYSALLDGGTGDSFCQIQRLSATRPDAYLADNSTEMSSGTPTLSAVGVVDVEASDTVKLFCASDAAFAAPSDQPFQIIVTPLDSVTTGAPLTATRGSGTN